MGLGACVRSVAPHGQSQFACRCDENDKGSPVLANSWGAHGLGFRFRWSDAGGCKAECGAHCVRPVHDLDKELKVPPLRLFCGWRCFENCWGSITISIPPPLRQFLPS